MTRSVTEDDGIESDSCDSQNSSSDSHKRHISFSVCNEVMKIDMTFEYLFDYFKYSFSKNNRPMNLDRILSDICTYVFLQLKCSVHIRKLKKEISLQVSHIVRSARVHAAGKSVIRILRKINNFTLFFKFINPLTEVQSIGEFIQYRNKDNLSPILLIRKTNDETDVFQFHPWLNVVEITFNDMFVKKTLSSFDVLGVLDIGELSYLISECALISDPKVRYFSS